MKWLGMLLLFANLAILGWGLQHEVTVNENRSVLPLGVGNLRLLSELVQTTQPIPAAATSGLMESEQKVDSSSAQAHVATPSGLVTLPEQPGSALMEEANRTARTTIPTLANVNQDSPIIGDSTASTGLSVTKESSSPVCGAFGYFERGTTARKIAESLANQGIDTSLRRESIQKPIGYWVIIPPLDTQQEAINKARQLRESGIADIRRFVKGDMKNGISLGVFSSEVNAKDRQQEVKRKGHNSKVMPRLITVPTYWVDYRSDRGRLKRVEDAFAERKKWIKNQQYPCSRVVTSGGIF